MAIKSSRSRVPPRRACASRTRPTAGAANVLDKASRRDPATATIAIEAALRATMMRIPAGQVATYGQIARLAGFPRHARMVGRLLHNSDECEPNAALPWHRIVNARGESSLPAGTARAEQWRRLRAERVEIIGDRINLEHYRWRTDHHPSPLLDD